VSQLGAHHRLSHLRQRGAYRLEIYLSAQFCGLTGGSGIPSLISKLWPAGRAVRLRDARVLSIMPEAVAINRVPERSL
jgi:hypothetical protein